jgi:signal transduction histidine kinase
MPERAQTILVVDDTEANRWVVRRILEESGFVVLEAGTGADAYPILAQRPDLVVLDARLPDTDGFTIARRLKDNPATASIPLLMVSASFTAPDAPAAGLDSGADSYLTHPVEPTVLIATVRALLRGKETERALRRSEQQLRAASREQERLLDRERAARQEADAAKVEADKARALAVEANVVKSQFLASMSHELRTPLNAIGGYVDLLELGIRGPLTAEQRADLDRVKHNQRHLLRLIDGILNFAKLEAGHIEYRVEDFAVRDILAEVEPLVIPQLAARDIRCVCRLPAPDVCVRADADKVQQILLNLVSNASKFTEPGGTVTIDTAGDPRHVVISVSDTGRGIPANKLQAIFEPFVQIRAPMSGNGGGTGLGLAISRDLARAMGGDLQVSSRLGHGATFRVELPRA